MWLRRLLESRLRLPNQYSISNVGTHSTYVCFYFRTRLDSEQVCFPLNLLSKSLLPSLTQITLRLSFNSIIFGPPFFLHTSSLPLYSSSSVHIRYHGVCLLSCTDTQATNLLSLLAALCYSCLYCSNSYTCYLCGGERITSRTFGRLRNACMLRS
jgi:hypothetical protein